MSDRRLLRAIIWGSVGLVATSLATGATVRCRRRKGHRVDLTERWTNLGLTAMMQAPRPTCSVFAVSHAIQFALAHRYAKLLTVSPEYLNWAKNQTTGEVTDGGFFHDLWAGFQQHGVCGCDLAPYQEKFDPEWVPSAEAASEGKRIRELGLELTWIKQWDINRGLKRREFGQILEALANGTPVLCGMRWPRKSEHIDEVLQWAPENDVFDGHSILILGYEIDPAIEGRGAFICIDSGGNGPIHKISFKHVRAYANDAAYIV